MKLSHKTLIIISGTIWFAVGCFLMELGLKFLLAPTIPEAAAFLSHYPLLSLLAPYAGGIEEAIIGVLAVSLFIGYFKGRYVLAKSAQKGVDRIRSFPNPTSLVNIYSPKYYVLLGAMIGIGMSMKYLGIPPDIRGMVDVAIGAALVNGAILYFRLALSESVKEKAK